MAVLTELMRVEPRAPWSASAVTVAERSWELRKRGQLAARLSLFADDNPPLPGESETRRIGRTHAGGRGLWIVTDLFDRDRETEDALVEILQLLTLTARRSRQI